MRALALWKKLEYGHPLSENWAVGILELSFTLMTVFQYCPFLVTDDNRISIKYDST